MIHPILPMTYLIPFRLVAGLGPSKPRLSSSFSPVKTEVVFVPSVVHTYSIFQCVLVPILYHNLLYIILFHILRFIILYLYYIIATIIYYLSML